MIAGIAARWIVRRPLAVIALFAAIAGASALALFSNPAFDSDVLSILPAREPAVDGLRAYRDGFSRERELAFALKWKSPDPGAAETMETFAGMLAAEPWVERVSPVSIPAPDAGFLVPMAYNLPDGQFRDLLRELSPDAVRKRVGDLASRAAAGSPSALFEMENDPLGIARACLAPLASSGMQWSEPLSEDGCTAVVACVAKSPDIAPIQEARAFLSRAMEELGPNGPEISITGHAAYAEEIEAGMQRDITLTSAVSLLCVIALFWLGFGRLLPLAGIVILLGFSAFASTAFGAVAFGGINAIAVGFCSILFGLGDDFSLLICEKYYSSLREGQSRESAISAALRGAGPGILWVSLTTALGFSALCFAGSAAFRQLGALVAVGVLVAAISMLAGLPLFLRGGSPRPHLAGPFARIAARIVKTPSRVAATACALFAAGAIIAFSPWRPLAFDLTPNSLEPKGIPAARTLDSLRRAFPHFAEPTLALVRDPDPEKLAALDSALERLKTQGLIANYASPTPFVLIPSRFAENAGAASGWDVSASLAAFHETLERAGFEKAPFEKTSQTLSALGGAKPSPDWSAALPASSPWRFLVDNAVAPNLACATLSFPPSAGPAERARVAAEINGIGGLALTGWTQMIVSLVPWAMGELALFGGAVLAAIAIVLLFIYRDFRDWAIHLAGIVAGCAAALAAIKLTGTEISVLNVLAAPLILGTGVDYGTHLLLAIREPGDPAKNLGSILKPVVLSGLTTISGFGALALASSPALSGLGTICAIGVAASLASAVFLIAPAALAFRQRPV